MREVLAFVLCVVLLMGVIPAEAAEKTAKIYVSPTGDDENAGSQLSPLKTLSAARDKARETGADEIVLTEGEYVVSETLLLDERDSGVKWTGENAVVTSARRIMGWTLYDREKNIYKAGVPEGFKTRQLYFNGEKARRSRSISYEGGYSNLDRTLELGLNSRNNREFYFNLDEVGNWNNFEDAELHLLTAWVENVFKLKKYDENKNFKETVVEGTPAAAVKVRDIESQRIFNRAHPDITGTTRGYASRSYYFFENAYEFIDEDTEWYIDKSENTIYFKAPAGTDMARAVLTVPTVETLVKVNGSKDAKAENITFENITFECTTWTRAEDEGLVGGQGFQYILTCTLDNKVTVYRPKSAFEAIYADKLSVTGCTFRKTGAGAIDFYYGVTNSRIFNNEIYDTAGNGITVAKFVQDENTEMHEAYNPTDKSEICSNIDVVNNLVHHIGTEYESAVGIIAGYAENIVIAHNEVHSTPYTGISVGYGWTSGDNPMKNNIIFANRLYDIGTVLCDFGAIYTLSKQPGSVCARNYINNVKRQPWFDYGYAAMYFDEQTEGYTIKENLACNIGSDAWGGGINFNGCASKNTSTNNYINVDINTNEAAAAIAGEAGIVRDKSCDEIAGMAEDYLDGILNPKEPYDSTDYNIYREIAPIKAEATKSDSGSLAEYAIDKNSDTSYTLSGQTPESMANEYLMVELDGEKVIDRIVIQREYNAAGTTDGNYWTDWCLAVGCELQGSMDKQSWETVGVMNPWPDGTGETDTDVYNIGQPKAYKYIRYIRTKYKTGSDYAVWRWSSTDGGNRLNVKDISFYTKTPVLKIEPVSVTATNCDEGSSPSYAADGDPKTSFTLSGQTPDSMDNDYLILELDGKTDVEKIIIRREFNAAGTTDGSYWTDWCLAVGCELQGSMDGQSWETVGVMNPWPDGTGDISKEIVEIENPKPYKYIRYIRTKYKTGSDYAVWRWASGDGGNRLNVKEIELYSAKTEKVRIERLEKTDSRVKINIDFDGKVEGTLVTAFYRDKTLIKVVTEKIQDNVYEYGADIPENASSVKVFILNMNRIMPLCEAKITYVE